ncbi:unnamed protein product [Discula destructiva]
MPKQYTILGRPVPRLSPRRISVLLASLAIFAVFSLLVTAPSSIPGPSLSASVPKIPSISSIGIPKWKSLSPWNPFKPPAHAPPTQANDTDGESRWYSDWRWLAIAFSSTYTLDEDRTLLPDVPPRTPIYCFYDTLVKRDPLEKEAESEILLSWRRAWWAQGFRPIILSEQEAVNNPTYEELQRMDKIEPELKTDVMRWLAWENMGGGLLAHYLAFPMGPHDDNLLEYLRRGEYQGLTRWDDFQDGLFAGTKQDITAAIKLVLGSSTINTAKDFLSALPADNADDEGKKTFWVDKTPKSLAYYNKENLGKKYDVVATAIINNKAKGLDQLNKLIVSHLHLIWQNTFNEGIAVLKPLPKHTTTMIQPAVELANRLQKCTESPMQTSCPPNNPKCTPCVASVHIPVSSPAHYRNTTGLYTIGTVPHPYTIHTINEFRLDINLPWIRRKCPRDKWLHEVTKELMGTGVGGAPRVIRFKEAVAAEYTASKSIWLLAEQQLPDDLAWHFGFEIPVEGLDEGKSETPVPGPERRPQPQHDRKDGPIAAPEELAKEPELLERAKTVVGFVGSTSKDDLKMRNAIEAWNLADTEAWKFARSFLARERVERKKFEEEESQYAGGVGTQVGSK